MKEDAAIEVYYKQTGRGAKEAKTECIELNVVRQGSNEIHIREKVMYTNWQAQGILF